MGSASSGHGFGDNHAALERAVRDAVNGQRLVGLSIATVRPARVARSAGYGHADVASGTPTAQDTTYL